MEQLLIALFTVVVGVLGCIGYFYISNMLLDAALPSKGPKAGHNITRANAIRPWLFMGPAILLLGIYLVYPVFNSLWLSVHDKSADEFVGMSNFTWMLGDAKFQESMYLYILCKHQKIL